MATGEFFDIVVRAKSIVSQGFQQAIAEARGFGAEVAREMIGGLGEGKIAATAGVAAQRIGVALDAVWQSGRKAAETMAEINRLSREAEGSQWVGLSNSMTSLARATEQANLAMRLANDLARERLKINNAAGASSSQFDSEFAKAKAHYESEVERQRAALFPDEEYLAGLAEKLRQTEDAVNRAKGAVETNRGNSIEEIERQESGRQIAQQAEWEEQARQNRLRDEAEARAAYRATAEENERHQEDLARMKAEIVETELRNAGKLLEADRARNAEQARAALERARSDEERKLIADRQRLADAKAEGDERERVAKAGKQAGSGSAGFDLVEITSRVSGFAALQKAGWEAALDKHGGRLERALAGVKWECGEMVRAVKQKRMDGIGLAF